jgi:predicted RNA polymerase sigma factor
VAQRIVRAKRTLSAARVPFEVPRRRELRERLTSVLEVVYLIFNEGYPATEGELLRPELMEEALRLGRILAELLAREAEVHGLVALMELHASRTRARTKPSGEAVLLLDQDRSRWDWLLVGRGWRRSSARTPPAARSGRTRCRPASPRATHAPARPRTPTGNGSRPSTTGWPS